MRRIAVIGDDATGDRAGEGSSRQGFVRFGGTFISRQAQGQPQVFAPRPCRSSRVISTPQLQVKATQRASKVDVAALAEQV